MKIVTCAFEDVSITSDATQDLWSLIAGASNRIRLLEWEITSNKLTATLISVALKRISAVGSGGSALTEQLVDPNGSAITGAVRAGDTTPGTAAGVLAGYQWEQLGPLGKIYLPEARFIASANNGFALVCNTAVAFTMSGFVTWAEE